MKQEDDKVNVLTPRKEVEQIYQFDSFLCELPEHIRSLVDGKYLESTLKSIRKEAMEDMPDYAVTLMNWLIKEKSEWFKQFYFKALGITYPYRLDQEDFERMGKKWDEVQDIEDFYAWFMSEYGPMMDEVGENEFGNSMRMFMEYMRKELADGALGSFGNRLTKENVEYVFSITKEHWDEYRAWLMTFLSDGIHAANTKDKEWIDSFLYVLFQTYHLMTEENFNNLFRLMQAEDGQLTLLDYRFIYEGLRKRGIAAYVQQRYDEYRSLKGGVDLPFYPRPEAEEVYNALNKYYPERDGWEQQAPFFTFLLQQIIRQVRPNLKNANEAVGFILILWNDDKHFDRLKKEGARFATFRKDLAEAFRLEHLGNLELSQGKPQVQKSALKVWDRHHTIFSLFVERKELLKRQAPSAGKAF